MNVVDILIIIVIALGAYSGWKHGMFSSVVNLIGTLLVFVIAFYMKNPLSAIFYDVLPFRNFGGIFSGITSFNILVYEALAYLICVIVLSSILGIILSVTGVLDKLVKLTIVFALPSKIIGLILSAFQFYIYVFIALFVCLQIPETKDLIHNSSLSNPIITNTPILSDVTNNLHASVAEIYNIAQIYEDAEKEKADYEALDVLMKYDIITPESVQKLSEKGKIKVKNVDELLKKYRKEK